MQRILEPGQIETFAQRSIPKLHLPDRARVFSLRAERLRQLGASGAIGQSIGDYLRLIAAIADAQQVALANCKATPPTSEQIAHARTYRMPLIHATGWRREDSWRNVLEQLCESVAALPNLPADVHDVCDRLRRLPSDQLEMNADALLAAQIAEIDVVMAPFLMAALQVYWVELASRLTLEDIGELDVRGVCPICGSLPVASVVRAEPRSQGFRYLHCALCATEWHLVRVTCSQCLSTKGISYQSIEGTSDAIRAECCDSCRTYRKILYQEKDTNVEPVADDLASLPLDLLLSEAGYHRASSNPLLWPSPQPLSLKGERG